MKVPEISASAARMLFLGIALLLTTVEFMPLFTGGFEYEIVFLGVHVGATLAIAYLLISWHGRRGPEDSVPLFDVIFALAALACAAYFAANGQRVAERIEGVDDVFPLDVFFGVLLIALLLEGCRRVAGLVLSIVTVIFILYVFAGPYIPGAMGHRGMTLDRFIDLQVLSTSGIFGTPISASAHMVFYFVVVGAFLERSGAGKLFVDIAYGVTARAWGGAGKAAIVASGLFGTVSGSAVANVLLSGLMTIPLMKRSGFKATLAGAIEATASTGGQLAPPIMGAAAFILADIVGVDYPDVVIAAITPALLYYISLYAVVHFYSLRHGLKPQAGVSIAEHLEGLRERWHLLLPLAAMIFLLISRYSLMTVGAYTTILIIALAMLRKATRMAPGGPGAGGSKRCQSGLRGCSALSCCRHHRRHAGANRHGAQTAAMAARPGRRIADDFASGSDDPHHYSGYGNADGGGISGLGDPGGSSTPGTWNSRLAGASLHSVFQHSLDGYTARGAVGLCGGRHQRRQSLENRHERLSAGTARVPHPLRIHD